MANDRISQLPVEVAISPTSGKARTSQLTAEVAISPTSGKARLSELVVEAVYRTNLPTTAKRRFYATIIG